MADLNRILQVIKNKIFLLIGRGILKAVEESDGEIMKYRINGLRNEQLSNIERPQDYGFEGYPPVEDETELVVVFPHGNRSFGICLKTHNRNYRPTDLAENETCLYHKNGKRVYMKNDDTIRLGTPASAVEAFLKGTSFKTALDAYLTAWSLIVPGTAVQNAAALTAIKVAAAILKTAMVTSLSTVIKGE